MKRECHQESARYFQVSGQAATGTNVTRPPLQRPWRDFLVREHGYPGCSHGRTPKMPIVLLRVVSPPTTVIDAYPLQRHRPSANRHEQQLLAEFPHVDSSTIISLEACRQAPLSGPQRRSASAHLQYKDDFVTDQRLGKLLATGLLL